MGISVLYERDTRAFSLSKYIHGTVRWQCCLDVSFSHLTLARCTKARGLLICFTGPGTETELAHPTHTFPVKKRISNVTRPAFLSYLCLF